MENLNNHQAITPESVLMAIQEATSRVTAEVKEMFKASRAELEASRAVFEASRAEFDQRMKKFDENLEASRAEFDQRMKKSNEAFDCQLKKMNEYMMGITESNSKFSEEYFFNSLENGQINFFIDEKIDKILPNVKGRTVNDEYDILFLNGKTTGIVECKYKARKDDIPKMLKKPDTFRINFPEYKNHKVYLAMAAFSINENCQRECIKQGIAVIKQVGDTIVVKNKHLKTF